MIDELVTLEEWVLLNRLREIPDGDVRTELMALLLDLAAYVRDPHCAHAQGDGVPCAASMSCEQCRPIERVLASVRQRVLAA